MIAVRKGRVVARGERLREGSLDHAVGKGVRPARPTVEAAAPRKGRERRDRRHRLDPALAGCRTTCRLLEKVQMRRSWAFFSSLLD